MKRILVILLAVFAVTACDDNITDINKSPYLAEDVPAGALFANAQKNTADNLASTNVNLNVFKLISQYWTETTYTDESNYDLTGRSIPDNWWDGFYTDVIKDLREAKRLTEEDPDPRVTADLKRNRIAVMNILEIYAWSILVETYGDIPYDESMDIENLLPAYDDAQTIHMDLIDRLNTALSNLDGSVGDFANYDLIYGGDTELWEAFGNSLKLRLGMMIADVPSLAATAKTVVEEAAPKAFSSNDQNADFQYLSATPNTNPLYVSLVLSGRKDFVAANTFVDAMKDVNDPRIPIYFTVDADGNYNGGIYGASNNYATYSKPGDFAIDPTYEEVLLSYVEVEFYKAEAAARGWSVSGTAASHYNAAITASMKYWGVADSEIDAYLAQPEVAYATAAGDYKQKIGMQKWFALYTRGWTAWTEWRRLDTPSLEAPADAVSDIPLRFPYPVSEQNLNTSNYNSAAAAIGGDDVTTKLFWDVN